MRIGILGGTFNPIHVGHISLAKQAKKILKLNKVIFMPAYIPPHKKLTGKIGAEDRFNMVKLAIKNQKGFQASRLEIDSKQKSYSIITLIKLKRLYPEADIFFIAGSDALPQIKNWKKIDDILKLSHFTVAPRPGYEIKDVPSKVGIINIESIDVSSTDIRARIKNNKSIKGLVPAAVRKCIIKKRLYKTC